MVDNVTPLSSSAPAAAPAKDTPERIHKAATQFEGLLIGEMLKSARESSSGGWMGTGDGDDAAGDSAMGLAEQYFAQAMATGGGLGLARMIGAGLEKQSSK